MTSSRQRFKAARLAAGFGQRAYARRIGVHKATVLRWESGFTPIPLNEMVRAARLFGVRREWLVFGTGSMRPQRTTAEAG